MNKLISKVSPLTKAILWFSSSPLDQNSINYQSIDYLLDGLLTSSLNAQNDVNSRVLIGNNFANKLHIFISSQTESSELSHFIKLIETSLNVEHNIILVDDLGVSADILKKIPNNLKNNIIVYQ